MSKTEIINFGVCTRPHGNKNPLYWHSLGTRMTIIKGKTYILSGCGDCIQEKIKQLNN